VLRRRRIYGHMEVERGQVQDRCGVTKEHHGCLRGCWRQCESNDGDGKPSHGVWTGKFDGKDYPVTGDPSTDTRSYKKVDDHTLTFINKKGDKVTISGRGVVSADGKTRTVTITGTDSKGTKFTTTAVYDKQ